MLEGLVFLDNVSTRLAGLHQQAIPIKQPFESSQMLSLVEW